MKNLLLNISLLVAIINCTAQETYQKPITHDRQVDEYLGWSTSIDGNNAAAGAPHHSVIIDRDTIRESGAVYLFSKNKQGIWEQYQRIVCNTPKSSDWFGTAVSISGKYLAIGANGFDKVENNSDHLIREGAVFIYRKDINGKWHFTQTITVPFSSTNDEFGKSLTLNKNRLIVAAPFYRRKDEPFSKNSSGRVFIYQLNSSDKWELKNQIIPKENIQFFGNSVFIQDSIALITSNNPETTYLYKLDTNLKDTLTQKFNCPDSLIKNFASSISITDNFIFIGASGEEDYGFHDIKKKPSTDSVFVIRMLTETDKGYSMTKKLIPNIKSSLDSFNISKEEFSKEGILFETWEQREERKAGAGAVYIYRKGTNKQWEFTQKIIASDRGADDHFGMCLSACDSLLIIGAFGDKLENSLPKEALYHGAAYIFQLNDEGKWIEIKKLTSNQNKNWLKFGFSVNTDGKQAIIGSRFEYINEDKKSGGVYIWEK